MCSIIIPVFNQVEYTKQCIEALYKNTPKGLFELIIVDNNSTDGTKNFLAHLEEDVKIISNPENLGFAKACNQGASEASGAFLLFLNNDTVPLPDWLEEMADSANSDVKVGIVGSKLLYPDGTIQHAGIGFINGIPDHPFRNLPGDHPEANIPKELDMVTGACLLIKKDLFFECGGFDEQYTNGVEDIDLCLKVRLTGHKVVYNPKSTLYHYEGKTPGRFDHVKENLEIFFSRWKNHFDDHGRMIYKTESQKIRIKWEGSQFVNHSLALVNRELCIQLANREDMELCIIPYELDEFGAEEDPARLGMIADRLNSPLSAAADFHIRHQWPPNFTPPPEGHWIIIQPWEFGALPKNWVVPMETLVDELWVPSNHVRDVYIQSGISPDKVFVVPNGVNYGQFHPQITKFPLDTNKKFKFLFVGGTIMRKGIDVLLSAYAELFSSEDDVCLVIKDMGGESFYKGQNASWMIADIKKDPTAPEILYITETLKNEEIAGLYTACDCLVHPYRGEGFGLPVAEAMACGLPVIVTKGGACDDFCSEKNAYLVSSTKRPIHLSSYELNGPGWLLEPDKSQLIEMLKFVYEHPDKARERGAIAAREIKRKVDWKMSKDLIVDRLRALKDKPIRRFAGSAHEHSGKDLKSPEEIYQNIQQSMENRQPQEVIAELEKLAESHPQFALAHNDLGVLHYTAGNKEKAHQYYENAVQLDPESLVFQKNLADYYYVELGRVEDALRIYVKILEANPEDTETLLITGHICVSQHRFDDARVFYRRVLALEPLNEDARNNLEKLDRMDSKAGEAETAQEIYQEMFPLLGNGDPHKAIKSLTELLERFPDFALAHNDLGVLYYRAGDKQRAQHHYERAVELTPDNINFQKNLADFYCIELGRIEDALKLYVSILAADPQDIETLMATAQICKALEKLDDAKDFFNQVLQIEPWNADARKQINEIEEPASGACLNLKSAEDVYRRLKERLNTLTPAEAIVEFEKLIDSYPDFAIGHNDLGVLYYNTDNKEKALRHYKQAAELQPENMTLQKNLADFLFVELGRVEDALQIYVGILATHPDDVETLLITGHICVALKRFDEAQDFYERVLALEPGNEDASQNLHAISNRRNERSTSQPDAFTAMSVSSAKVEAMDLNSKASENTDTEGKTSASIVVSLNGIQNRVKECLKSIQVHTAAPYQLLLIDRDTGKGIQKWAQQLAEANDDYHLIACTRQAGWAECINQAVEKADGELIVLMHNDVVLPEGWLNTFLMGIHFEPNTGVVGPMCNRVAGIQQIIQTDESDRTDFEATAAAFYEQNRHRRVSVTKLSDICLVFRRELVEKIGSFDKQYASAEICVEDFCNRAAAAGYKNWVAADTYVYHYDRHKAQKKFAANNSASTEDRKIYKEKWNGAPTPEARAFQTVQLLAKAEEFSQKGQIDQAVETLLVGIGTHAEDKRPYYALAEILLAAKRFQDAKEALNEIPSTNGDAEPQKLELLGYAEEGLANHKASQACVEQLLAINPRHAPALNLKGNLAYHDADPSSAEKYFKRAIDADPGYAKPFTNMGILQMEAGRHADALNSIEMGFRLCPTDLDIATHYHSLVTEIAGFENAEPVAREAAALYPNNQKVKYMLIDFMIQQGKYELAMPEIEDAIIRFGLEDGILGAALKIREKLGPMTVDKSAKKVPVSLCMIIKDEEKYLARCLASVKPIVDEMIVVDTGSNDRSKDIAVTFGARVYTYDWQNDFAAARNFSISKASGDWILILDGDEVISPLDHEQFNKMVAKKPKAPVAYSITTRNYNPLANIVGWVSNDGNYPAEEATIGWLPSEKVRLFYGKDQIWFEGAVHEMVDPVLKRNTIEIKKCNIPVHHYGRLDKKKLDRKGEIYFEIGQKKLAEMGEDPNALRELAIQATILERNQEGLDLWKRLLALNPFPELTAVAYVNMGTIYSRLERFEDALDVSKKAMAVDPDLKEAQYNCALAELHCGHSAAAIETLEKLLRSFPDYPPAQFILCAAYCCADQKDRGLEGIQNQKKTPMGVHLAMPFFELGQSLIAAKQIPYALAVLGAAIESDIVSKQILELFNKCIQMRETTQNSQERHPVVEAGSASGQF
ncbi:MAG: glycosyltransferase [Desulfobacterales bacterium]